MSSRSVAAPPLVDALAAPRLRGRLHQVAFGLSVPAGIGLVAVARGAEARIGTAIFALSLSAVYGVSAVYHRRAWSPRGRVLMQRVDHAMIFVLIAGTATPVALIALRPAWGIPVLAAVWIGGLVGVVLVATRLDRLDRVVLLLYVPLGWLPAVATPELLRALGGAELGLLLAGGLLYTGGALMLAANWPRLWPAVFGYHEVWHVMVVAAGACHYVAVVLIARAG